MQTEVIYVTVPTHLKRSLEALALQYRYQARDPHTLKGMVIKACDELLARELPQYTSDRVKRSDGERSAVVVGREGTHADQIMRAVATVIAEGVDIFTRADIRDRAGVDSDQWNGSYSPIFQGMRIDHPGGAPQVGTRFKGVFRRVDRGHYTLTPHGQELLQDYVL